MARRLEPGWNFSTLYLIKDSLAIMLEAAGLLEDAFREYFELEACYLEALEQGGNLAGRQFGQLSCHNQKMQGCLTCLGSSYVLLHWHGGGIDHAWRRIILQPPLWSCAASCHAHHKCGTIYACRQLPAKQSCGAELSCSLSLRPPSRQCIA